MYRAAGETRVLSAAGKDVDMIRAVARDRELHAAELLAEEHHMEQLVGILLKQLDSCGPESRAFVFKVGSVCP